MEELVTLRSIYCAPGEFVVVFPPTLSSDSLDTAPPGGLPAFVTIEIALHVPVGDDLDSHECIQLKVALTLSREYPVDDAPLIELASPHLKSNSLTELGHDSIQYGLSLKPEPSLFAILERLKLSVADTVQRDPSCLVKTARKESEIHPPRDLSSMSDHSVQGLPGSIVLNSEASRHVCVAKIDHMRSERKYFKLLKSWSEELDMSGKVVNAGPHHIYTLLLGDERSLAEFVRRWRTQCVDEDAQGRPCRERLMRVLCQSEQAAGVGGVNCVRCLI